MKILIVHNDYGKYSGEEAVVDKMAKMLGEHGHEVAFYRLTSAGSRESALGQIKGFVCGFYSPNGVRGLREVLRREKPDVVNVHNLYPFISPAALFECRKAGVPVVMTVHNFRLICPTGLFMRDGEPCERCLEHGNEWGCIRYNCENSWLKSLGYAGRNMAARCSGAYRKCVTRFACITDFQRHKLIEAGFEAERIIVIPNSVDVKERPNDSLVDSCNSKQSDPKEINNGYVGFCGRLSAEKGIDLILEVARRHPEIPFHLAGEARDKELIEKLPPNVKLLGYITGKDLEGFYKSASFLIMASRCYEGFAMSILEAAQYHKPMVAPDHGGFTEIIGKGEDQIGLLFAPGDADSLESSVVELWQSPEMVSELGEKANAKLRAKYSTEVIYKKWEQLLSSLIPNTDERDE